MRLPSELKKGYVSFQQEVQFNDSDSSDVRTFEMLGYSGSVVDRSFGKMVLNMEGIEFHSEKIPILLDHNPEKIVGYASEKTTDTTEGVRFSGPFVPTDEAKRVVDLADSGFPWQSSIGFTFAASDVKRVSDKKTVKVNNQELKGPLFVVEKCSLKECSFVSIGADGKTGSSVFSDADDNNEKQGEEIMTYDVQSVIKECKKAGVDSEALMAGVEGELSAGEIINQFQINSIKRLNEKLAQKEEELTGKEEEIKALKDEVQGIKSADNKEGLNAELSAVQEDKRDLERKLELLASGNGSCEKEPVEDGVKKDSGDGFDKILAFC